MGRMDDYVEVPERIELFYATYPEGRLVTSEHQIVRNAQQDIVGMVVTAAAYRTPDDGLPAIGVAWEPFPGLTNFTKNSELMNAETSAWGRAIVALGPPFVTKRSKIASREEVENRQSEAGVEEKPADFAETMRETKMKAADIKAWLQTEGGFEGDAAKGIAEMKGEGLAKFLNGLDEEKQAKLLAWAK